MNDRMTLLNAIEAALVGAAHKLGLDARSEWSDVTALSATLQMDLSYLGDQNDRGESALEKLARISRKAAKEKDFVVNVIRPDAFDEERQAILSIIFENEENFYFFEKNGNIENYINYLDQIIEEEIRRRRPKRRRDQLPDPTKSPNANVNRKDYSGYGTDQFNVRVSPETIELEKSFRKRSGMSKRELTERALEEFIRNYDAKECDIT